jgi:hypothetical protein
VLTTPYGFIKGRDLPFRGCCISTRQKTADARAAKPEAFGRNSSPFFISGGISFDIMRLMRFPERKRINTPIVVKTPSSIRNDEKYLDAAKT